MCSRLRGSLAAVLRTEPRGGAPWPLPSTGVVFHSPARSRGDTSQGELSAESHGYSSRGHSCWCAGCLGRDQGKCLPPSRLWETAALLRGKSRQLFLANLLICRGCHLVSCSAVAEALCCVKTRCVFMLVTDRFPGDVTFLFHLWVQLLALLTGVPNAKVPLDWHRSYRSPGLVRGVTE